MKPAAQSNWHTIMDARNRELHRAIAEKMRENPTLVLRVRKTLERWLRAMNESERGYDALLEWKRRLEEQPLARVLELFLPGTRKPVACASLLPLSVCFPIRSVWPFSANMKFCAVELGLFFSFGKLSPLL